MRFPYKKNIIIMSTPPTFVEERLCPLGLVPIPILKMVTFLKKLKNRVTYINMHSGEALDRYSVVHPHEVVAWKEKRLCREGNKKALMYVNGKSFKFFQESLKNIEGEPDEFWISCSFTTDYDLVGDYIKIVRKKFPDIKVVAGGDFIRFYPEIQKKIGADEYFLERIPEADLCRPDFSVSDKWTYGLFQLQTGCVNKCSFCVIGKDRPVKFDPKEVISYIKEFHNKFNPESYWNWDPNVSLFPKVLDEFLQLYIEAKIPAALNFGKGLQPNLVKEEILRKMAMANTYSVTLPMECANYETTKRLNKPYTIISSIKLLDMAKRAGLKMNECRCTSLLGYPDDDFKSFFRIYISILKYGAAPSPFPVFIFPNSPDYYNYYELIKHKDLSELHGQLWPLLPEKDLEKYKNLFKFIELANFRSVKDHLHLLSRDLKEILLRELENSDKFINLCLNAPKDDLEEFKKIEKELNMKRIKKTKNLLYIVANPKKTEKAISRQLGEYFISKYQKLNPYTKVTIVDLYKEGLSYINEEYVDIVFYKEKKKKISPETENLLNLVEKYIKQLREADEIVIATPMFTLAIPAILKSYFEMIASRLYYYYDKNMLSPKPVTCIITRDGIYPPNGQPMVPGFRYINAQETMLKAALDFLGLSKNPKFIICEGLERKEYQPISILKAKKAIDEYVSLNATR